MLHLRAQVLLHFMPKTVFFQRICIPLSGVVDHSVAIVTLQHPLKINFDVSDLAAN